jgi:glycosyltransferase involved in cell wall biosynthesis
MGSVREVIDEGVTGFRVLSIEAAVEAVRKADGLDRAAIREVFDRRFTAARMARDYVEIYQRMLAGTGG